MRPCGTVPWLPEPAQGQAKGLPQHPAFKCLTPEKRFTQGEIQLPQYAEFPIILTGSVGPRAELYPALFFQGCCSLTETRQSGHLAHNRSTANRELLGSSQTALRGKIQQLFHHLIPTYTLLLDRAQITASLLHSRRTHAPSSSPQRRSLLLCF